MYIGQGIYQADSVREAMHLARQDFCLGAYRQQR